jgi:SAM-dependent methyltransferase
MSTLLRNESQSIEEPIMSRRDIDNLALATSTESVDKLNALFYRRFPYPWLPGKFDYLEDPNFETVMLNQSLGYWDQSVIPENPRIWVAGCGTNQAIFTALKFPKATVTGSDVSDKSLALCANSAKQLGISNLELKQESINEVPYRNEFDYVICTGVIHHNADPTATLGKLATALKDEGLLELMVYNRFHWIIPTAFLKAVRILGATPVGVDFESELSLTRRLVNELPQDSLLGMFLSGYRNSEEAALADALLQPVIYSYTVESLEEMAASSDLEILSPYISQFDKSARRSSWNMEFKDPVLKNAYNALPDIRRWQLANLLMLEKSPMLWFYLQRTGNARARISEQQICESFLNQRLIKTSTIQKSFIRDGDGRYRLSSESVSIPAGRPADSIRQIIDLVDGKTPMRDILKRLGIPTTFDVVNKIRAMLTTPAFPYLKAC